MLRVLITLIVLTGSCAGDNDSISHPNATQPVANSEARAEFDEDSSVSSESTEIIVENSDPINAEEQHRMSIESRIEDIVLVDVVGGIAQYEPSSYIASLQAIIKDDFPLPVRPQTPIFSPPLTVKVRSFNTSGPSRYLIEACVKSISPVVGHVPSFGSLSGMTSGASGSMLSV